MMSPFNKTRRSTIFIRNRASRCLFDHSNGEGFGLNVCGRTVVVGADRHAIETVLRSGLCCPLRDGRR